MVDNALKCVLLADRHHRLTEGVWGLLETAFGGVFMVADPVSLMEGAERLRPTLAVVDLSLADSDIGALLSSLRTRTPATKILVLSVHDEPTVAAAVLAAGADGVILKRSIATDLLPAIEAVLAGRRYSSSTVAHDLPPDDDTGDNDRRDASDRTNPAFRGMHLAARKARPSRLT